MSHVIDYSDHYAHSDPGISEFNYLQFDEQQWAKVNPSIHFQNRLRTPFYTKLFVESGFQIIEFSTWKGARECLENTPVSRIFGNLSFDELRDLGSNYLLRKL
jgi:hypothetical protein